MDQKINYIMHVAYFQDNTLIFGFDSSSTISQTLCIISSEITLSTFFFLLLEIKKIYVIPTSFIFFIYIVFVGTNFVLVNLGGRRAVCVVYVNLCAPQTDSNLIGWTGNLFEFLCNNSQIKR